MSPMVVKLLISIAIQILTRYKDHLTDEQKAAWAAAIKNMPTQDELHAAEEAAKPWYGRKLEQ